MQEPDPEIVNKLERILQNGKNSKTDPDALAVKVTLKAIELLSIPQCAGGNNNNSKSKKNKKSNKNKTKKRKGKSSSSRKFKFAKVKKV